MSFQSHTSEAPELQSASANRRRRNAPTMRQLNSNQISCFSVIVPAVRSCHHFPQRPGRRPAAPARGRPAWGPPARERPPPPRPPVRRASVRLRGGRRAVVEGHVEPVHGCERGRPGSVGWGRAAAGVRVGAGSSRHGRRRCQERRRRRRVRGELELELIQSQMAQKPMLRGEVGARAWRVLKRMGKRSRLPRSLRARGKLALVPLSMPSTSLPYRSRLTWDLHTNTHTQNKH